MKVVDVRLHVLVPAVLRFVSRMWRRHAFMRALVVGSWRRVAWPWQAIA